MLDHVRDRMVEFQEETGHLYNLEATPAEGTTYRFAKEDRRRFPGILQAGTDENPYYTNSSQLPVNFTSDPFEAVERQSELQSKYTTIVESISESLKFMRTIGADTAGQLQTVDLYTSHEGLLLAYEESLTRRLKHPSNRNVPPTYKKAKAPKVSPLTGGALIDRSIQEVEQHGYYNTSAHFLWVGDRTRQPGRSRHQ